MATVIGVKESIDGKIATMRSCVDSVKAIQAEIKGMDIGISSGQVVDGQQTLQEDAVKMLASLCMFMDANVLYLQNTRNSIIEADQKGAAR